MRSVNQTISSAIAAFDSLGIPELRRQFKESFGYETSLRSAEAIRKRLAYRAQEQIFGGLTDGERRILDKLADDDPMSKLEKTLRPNRPALPGSRLQRVWKGKLYEVTVAQNGAFEYGGKYFKSLSAVAREITGTQWNGKIFFGVKK